MADSRWRPKQDNRPSPSTNTAPSTRTAEAKSFLGERQIRNGAFVTCRHYLSNNERYELKTQLDDIGSRTDKHW
ncbi:hypothetical protein NQ318_022375 [Aromia moschata]|uniref:Uncharacterized protein n=1 Tax=Aromia moschata TaxID=1265417 RepID=A0AAV8Z5J5_9CUCU|nr:hypothetical protein NQ318_022375 [Aromia moschata]